MIVDREETVRFHFSKLEPSWLLLCQMPKTAFRNIQALNRLQPDGQRDRRTRNSHKGFSTLKNCFRQVIKKGSLFIQFIVIQVERLNALLDPQ
jgi:hypothetical protein